MIYILNTANGFFKPRRHVFTTAIEQVIKRNGEGVKKSDLTSNIKQIDF